MSSEEPTGTCVCCWQVDPDRGYVCERDRQRLARALWQLRDLHALLPHALAPGRGAQQLVRTGRAEAPLPLRADPLDLAARPPANAGLDAVQDYRGDQVGAIGVAAILDGWARDWATYRDDEELPDPTVDALVLWLSRRLDWACSEHPAVDDFAKELTVTLYTCRSVLSVSEAPIYSDLACPRCKTAALRRQAGDAVWRCGECREEVQVEHLQDCECVDCDPRTWAMSPWRLWPRAEDAEAAGRCWQCMAELPEHRDGCTATGRVEVEHPDECGCEPKESAA